MVAFSTAGAQFADFAADGGTNITIGLVGFALCMFGTVWAWVHFTWFASSFDTDDWLYRLAMFSAMAGVIIFALGIPDVFTSLGQGQLDYRQVVLGYVVMRVALLSQWLRVLRHSQQHRNTALAQIVLIGTAQCGWILFALLHLALVPALLAVVTLIAYEVIGARLIAVRIAAAIWHPHHLAERYSLLAIITLGEGVVGTVAVIGAAIEHGGWTVDTILLVIVGLGLTCTMWWSYFYTDYGALLERHPNALPSFVYLHIVLYGAIAAVGAGLHIVSSSIEGEARISALGVLSSVAVPVGVYIVLLFLITSVVTQRFIASLWLWPLMTLCVLAVAAIACALGLPVGWALLIVSVAPMCCVFGADLAARRIHSDEE